MIHRSIWNNTITKMIAVKPKKERYICIHVHRLQPKSNTNTITHIHIHACVNTVLNRIFFATTVGSINGKWTLFHASIIASNEWTNEWMKELAVMVVANEWCTSMVIKPYRKQHRCFVTWFNMSVFRLCSLLMPVVSFNTHAHNIIIHLAIYLQY